MEITNCDVKTIAVKYGLTYAQLMAFIEVESGGRGFINGKLVIQFEPAWFKKYAPFAPSGAWSLNKVENQEKEYKAFNDAFAKNKIAAMMSTSIGLPQIMGFHYATLGYKSVGDMWDDFKRGEYQQVEALAKFIKASPALWNNLKANNWHGVAVNYNGAGYKELAKKYGREPYNVSMEKAYNKYLKVIV